MEASDKQELVRLLKIFARDQAQHIPFGEDLFSALLQCVPIPSIECVIARFLKGKIEVFLTQRAEDDPFYSKQWHVPGSFLRLREKISEAMRRVSETELAPALIGKYQFIMPNNNGSEPRGHSVGLVYLCEMAGEPTNGEWFEIWPNDRLPLDFIQFQRDFLMPALGPFFIDRLRPT
jgi:ADP-ribose pyrophosphatase YjhB (NUDIX family)